MPLGDSFLGRFNDGEANAIQSAFVRYKDDLVVCVGRRLDGRLRGKFDSEDVVHSLWARLLPEFRARRWRFDDVRQLRAFLLRAANNRLANRARRVHLEQRYVEERLASQRDEPPAGVEDEALRMEETWQNLLACCPAQHRDVLRLKREGRSLDEIAALKGLHKGTVRRILYETLERLHEGRPLAEVETENARVVERLRRFVAAARRASRPA